MSIKQRTYSNDKKPTSKQQSDQQPDRATLQRRAGLDRGSVAALDILQLQRTAGNRAVGRLLAGTVNAISSQKQAMQHRDDSTKGNRSGLPDKLKTGIEGLSGMTMDDVKVHYNSSKPAEVQALAHTQGSNIYIRPGQEKHLPHEAWHVAQQKQGRVKSTGVLAKGASINDDPGLEREADQMGAKALSANSSGGIQAKNQLGARAFTVGSHIYVNDGAYSPDTTEGKHLLAHGLTHAIQPGRANSSLQRDTVIQRALAPMEISAIADEIRNATQIWGTDEERIFRNLQRLNRDPAEIQSLMAAYQLKYHVSLEALLRDEMSGSELRLALEEINIKDDLRAGNLIAAAAPSNPAEYRFAAQRLQSAMAGLWSTDEETIYAVLIPFNRDPVKLSELKLTYLSLTHNALIADIKDEMSSTELDYALFLLNTTAETDDTADTMKGMVGTEAGWVPYGTVSGNTFGKWASAPTEAAAPPLSGATTINCWEMILYAAYKAAAIDWQWIHNLYVNIDVSKWVSVMTSSLSNYSAGDKLTRGQLVFFNGLAHVTLATGNGDEVYTFWPPPDIPIVPFAPGAPAVATIDKVKTSSIHELSTWMTAEYKKTPVVQAGDPAWWVSH